MSLNNISGFFSIPGPAGPQGATGATGPTGSAGTLTVTNAPGVTAPVYASFVSTPTSAVFNGIVGDGTTTQVTTAPVTGGNITVSCTSNVVTLNDAQTLNNKTLNFPTINTPSISAINNGGNIQVPSGMNSVFALQSVQPQTSDNLCSYFNSNPTPAVIKDSGISANSVVTLTGVQTLANKTLTLPTIASINNGGTITIPSGAGTLATIGATQTLTGKTLTAPLISKITGTGTAPSIVAGAAAGTAPTVTVLGTETGGVINVTTGTSPLSGVVCTITNAAFANTNYAPLIFPANTVTAQLGPVFVSVTSTTQWTINAVNSLGTAVAYSWRYQIQG